MLRRASDHRLAMVVGGAEAVVELVGVTSAVPCLIPAPTSLPATRTNWIYWFLSGITAVGWTVTYTEKPGLSSTFRCC